MTTPSRLVCPGREATSREGLHSRTWRTGRSEKRRNGIITIIHNASHPFVYVAQHRYTDLTCLFRTYISDSLLRSTTGRILLY